jgi:hypothetical protein
LLVLIVLHFSCGHCRFSTHGQVHVSSLSLRTVHLTALLLPVLLLPALQPYGLSCAENVAKECWEEAGVPQELAAAAVPVGFVSYVSMSDEGLKPDVLFCYDLQLPANFVPQPQDGEVRACATWGCANRALSTQWLGWKFKTQCSTM